jgi:YfiH family protein
MSWQSFQHGVAKIYQASSLNQAGLVQGFSTKGWGNLALHTGDHPDLVVKRRRQFLSCLGLQLEKLVAANQVHGTQVQVVEAGMAGAGAGELATALSGIDALITEVPGLVLAVFTADCLPIFLYDLDRPAVAVVHAGWRGTLDRIVERTVVKMVEQYRTVPEKLWAAIGPAICSQCFQVGPDLAERFVKADSQAVQADAAGYYVDLAGFNTRLLVNCGVALERIERFAPCTGCNRETFFSYRAEGQTNGRMMGIISLKSK